MELNRHYCLNISLFLSKFQISDSYKAGYGDVAKMSNVKTLKTLSFPQVSLNCLSAADPLFENRLLLIITPQKIQIFHQPHKNE